jgi:hypothetical protein
MRYLRMLTNSVLAGALGAGFVGVLILQLNQHVPLSFALVPTLGHRLWLFYGTNLAVFFYALIVVAQLLSRDGLSPGWLSLRLLAWSSTLVAATAAALMWLNLRGFARVLDEEPARRLAAGAAATSVCALLLLLIAVVHYSFGRRGSRVGGTLYALTVVAAIGLPLAARGAGGDVRASTAPGAVVPAVPDQTGRIFMVLLDGASLDFISPVTAEGRLPHFARLLEEGAAMHLSTIRPTQPGPVWAAALTGVYPPRSGIRAAERYRFGAGAQEITLLPDLCLAHALVTLDILEAVPQDATAFRARPLWRVLSEIGVSVGVTGVPLTHPAPPVAGYLLSDRLHLLPRATMPYREPDLVYPPDVLASLPDAAFEWPIAAIRQSPGVGPLPRDVFYRRLAASLDDRIGPRVRMIRYEGIDVAGHHYLRYARPDAFGDVSPEERLRLGQVLEQQYGLVDAELGQVMASLTEDDLLLVVSGFGMEPQSPGKRLLARVLGEAELSGTHERAPDGFLLAWGRGVAAGRWPVGAIVDVTPTLLYYLGLPVARDMDGFARTDIFTEAFTADRPVSYIPTYGS